MGMGFNDCYKVLVLIIPMAGAETPVLTLMLPATWYPAMALAVTDVFTVSPNVGVALITPMPGLINVALAWWRDHLDPFWRRRNADLDVEASGLAQRRHA